MSASPRPASSHGRRILACLCVAAGLAGLRAEVLTAPSRQWVTDAPVQAAAARGDVAYLGGGFQYIGQVSDSGPSFVEQSSGTLTAGCATRTGTQTGVRPVVMPDSAGGLFMQVPLTDERLIDGAGAFPASSGESFIRIGDDCKFVRSFHLETFVPGDPLTRGLTIVRTGDVIYVAGTRTLGFGDLFGRVAMYDGTTGARQNAWDYNQFSMVLIDGVTPSGQLVVTVTPRGGDGTSGEVGILQPSTSLFVRLATVESVDSFVHVLGTTLFVLPAANRPLQAFDLATGLPKPGWSSPVLSVTDLELAGGRVYVAGSGLGRTGVFALAADTGALIAGFAPALSAPAGVTLSIERLALVESRLFVRGRTLRALDGNARYLLAAVDAATGEASTWAPIVFAPTATSVDLVPLGARLFIGRVAAPVVERRTHLAAVNTATGAVLPFDPNGVTAASVVPPVTALAVDEARLFAGTSQSQIRRVSLATGVLDPWSVTVTGAAPAAGTVAALLLDGSTLYAGGQFTGVVTSSQPTAAARSHALAVDATNASLLPWYPEVTGGPAAPADPRPPITSLTMADGMVILGGNFSALGAEVRAGLAAVDKVTGAPLVPGLTLAAGETVLDTDQDGTQTVFVGVDAASGPFIGVADSALEDITRWTVGTDVASRPSAAVAWSGGVVYSGVEWDVETGLPLEGSATWVRPVAIETGLLELADRPDGPDGPAITRFHAAAEGNARTAPRDLTVQYSGTEAYLTWRPPARGEVDSYIVRAGGVSGERTLADFDTGSVATTLHARAPEGVYFVRVHARHGAEISGPSNEVSFALVPLGCNAPPRAPGALSGTTSGGAVSLRWGAAINAASYVIEAGSQPGLADIAVLGMGPRLELQVGAPAGRYVVRARGVNNCGRGAASNEVILNVGGPPPSAPTNLRVRVTGRTVALEWAAPTVGEIPAFYQVEAGSAPGLSDVAVARTVDRSVVAVGVVPGRYFVRVRAGNDAGVGEPTADVVVDVSP